MAKDPPAERAGGEPASGGEPSVESNWTGSLRAEGLARMGHELRTPLNAIIGFIKLVEDGLYSTDDERQDYLANARQSALTLLDLINKILDLARIEAGHLWLESKEFELVELVEEVARTMAPEAHTKGIEVETVVDAALPPRLLGDALRLRQVLFNLVGNAVKFTDSGLVLLRADVEANDGETCQVRFTVRDTGIGVPAELQSDIFDSFIQTRTDHTEQIGGTGLGLAIARQIVEQMGGTISLTSRLHEGSTFWFTLSLPVDRGYRTRLRRQPEALRGVSVLLINPDPETREIYLAKLDQAGAHAEAIATGDEAWQRLTGAQGGAAPYRVVLLDNHLQRDEVLVLARRVRREEAWFQPDLVQLTSMGAATDAAALRESGITEFITKPASPNSLRSTLGNLLKQQGPRGVEISGPGETALEPGQAASRGPKRHVLVAEDNVVNQKLVQALLTKQGYTARLVANGREAVEAVRGDRFDAVLMDVQMPVLDGLAAARAIRQMPAGRDLPIIAMTADALDGDRERCLAAGMDDHVPKPIMPEVLSNTLNRWLEREAREPPAAPPAGPPPPLLDGAHLATVRTYAADHEPQRFLAWVQLFRAEAGAALKALADCGNTLDAAEAAERLALACAGFGAPRLLAVARRIGQAAELGEQSVLATLVAQAQATFAESEQSLEQSLAPGPTPHPPEKRD